MLIDDDGFFRIWRARGSHHLLLKESRTVIDGKECVISSIYDPWDVVTQVLLPPAGNCTGLTLSPMEEIYGRMKVRPWSFGPLK